MGQLLLIRTPGILIVRYVGRLRQVFCTVTLPLLVVFPAGAVTACTLCVGLPEQSDADYLIRGHCVILAREDSGRPFSFAPLEVLKGEFDGRGIGLLVDSVTRRRLAADPELKVVLVQDQPRGPWRRLGLASPKFEAVVRRILVLSPSWEGKQGRIKRVEFFMPLFGHEDPQIYRLAYLEMGRADYGVIKRLGRVVQRAQIMPMLEQRQYIEWRPLAILILAQNPNVADRQYIWRSLESAQQLGLTRNLAAWTTAALEINSQRAISFIEEHYFRRLGRTPEELAEVLKALSLHGHAGSAKLRDRILAAYAVLLENHPAAKASIAGDLAAWTVNERG
jgi:hypothetical protein